MILAQIRGYLDGGVRAAGGAGPAGAAARRGEVAPLGDDGVGGHQRGDVDQAGVPVAVVGDLAVAVVATLLAPDVRAAVVPLRILAVDRAQGVAGRPLLQHAVRTLDPACQA